METRSPDDFELFLEGILEAPRGQREVCPDGIYKAAYKNGPTASVFPCGANGCGNGCKTGSCGTAPAAGLNTAGSSIPSATPQAIALPKGPSGGSETTAAPLPAESTPPAALPPAVAEPAAGDSGEKK
jgi:pilus assembly protein CpaC